MDIRIFAAGAMPQVGAELKHGESVFQHTFSEFGIVLPVFFGDDWKIEHDHDPHNTVFVEAHFKAASDTILSLPFLQSTSQAKLWYVGQRSSGDCVHRQIAHLQ